MSISQPLSAAKIKVLEEFFHSDSVNEGCFDYLALHGFLTGLAAGHEALLDEDWMSFIFDGQAEYQNKNQQQEIESTIHQLATYIQRSLYLGEDLELPCSLEAAEDNETNELTDWCFGFIEAIALNEDAWFSDDTKSDSIAELILPMGLLSEQFADPDLEHLMNDEDARQELADSIIENIQNLFLLFRE